MNLEDLPVIFLDAQTTGFATSRGELLELGWSLESDPAGIQSQLIRIESIHDISPRVWEMTGIQLADLEHGLSAGEVWKNLLAWWEGATLVPTAAIIHYAQFEMPFFRSLHETVAGKGVPVPWEVFCSYRIARKLFPKLPSWSIRAMSGYFGIAMPENHRARDHVAATERIWRGVVTQLAVRQSIHTVEELRTWLEKKSPPQKRIRKREFQITPEKRLSLKPVPGIYEMLSRDGKVLYVGKATSLRDRVNSYFRGGRSERSQLPELLSQVYDVQVTPTATALEAALLESDRIKALRPPYNRLLKGSAQNLCFASLDLQSFSNFADEAHPWGPFSSTMVLEELVMLSRVLRGEVSPEVIFQIACPPETLAAAAAQVAGELKRPANWSVASLLAMGKVLLRQNEVFVELTEDERDVEAIELSEEEAVKQSFIRKLKRPARQLRQAHWINRLAHSCLALTTVDGWRLLRIEKAKIVGTADLQSIDEVPPPSGLHSFRETQNAFDRAAYDRMKICLSEITLRWNRNRAFQVKFSQTRKLTNQ